MDWVGIAVAAVSGAFGGLLGGLASLPFKSKSVRSIITVVGIIVAVQLASIFVTPWAETEYLFAYPPTIYQSVIAMAPEHVSELKANMRKVFGKPNKAMAVQQVIQDWILKYGKKNFLGLLASRNRELADKSFTRFMAVFTAVSKKDELICYEWLSGRGLRSADELGLTEREKNDLRELLQDVPRTSSASDVPLPKQAVSPELRDMLIERIKQNWDPARVDFDAMAQIPNHIPTKRARNACYTAYAFYSEIGKLKPADRMHFMQSMFGT